MSLNADCQIKEVKPGEWWYFYQRWPYGLCPHYNKFGPFKSQEAAEKHLRENQANPGGWSVEPYNGDK